MTPTTSRRRLITLGIAAAAIALALPASVSAQRGPGARGGFANNPGMQLWNALDQRFDGFTEQLALNEEQFGLVTVLAENFREENKSALGRYRAMMTEMRGQARGAAGGARRGGGGGGGNRQGMRQGMQELRALVQELSPAFETLHEDISKLLTEEQVKSMTQLLERQRPGG